MLRGDGQKLDPLTRKALLATIRAMKLVLASRSTYRAQQLKRLGLSFISVDPNVDEKHLAQKHALTPEELSQFLGRAKAQAVRSKYPDHVVIGGDQLVELNGQALGKPGSIRGAIEQLTRLQGTWHRLVTSMTLFYNDQELSFTSETKLKLHPLTNEEIRAYVARDNPIDCAGSYKIELAGWSLVAAIESDDPSAIEGLSLIQLSKGLRDLGFTLEDFWKN